MRCRSRAQRPPALRGIITVCSTDDRYADDVHYMGGCLLNDNLWWGGVFFQLCAQPPDPSSPATAGARAGRSGSRPRIRTRCAGSRIRCATTTGARAPCARTTPRSRAPSTRSAAGPTPTPTRIPRHAGRTARARGAAWSGPGATRIRTRACRPAVGFLQDALACWDECLRGAPARARTSALSRVDVRQRAGRIRGRRPAGRWSARRSGRRRAASPACCTSRADGSARPAHPPRWRSGRRSRPAASRAPGSRASLRDQRDDDADSLCFDASRCASAASCSARRAAARARVGPAGRVRGRAACATLRPTGLHARLLRRLEPHPRARPRVVGAARPGPALRGLVPLERRRARVSGRPPGPARARERLLATRVAVAVPT
jgi:hypothetical protein